MGPRLLGPFVFISFALFGVLSLAHSQEPTLLHWKAEAEPHMLQVVECNDTMDIVARTGATLWYKQRLSGNYEVSYRACVVMEGGAHDRLSDLNCFWGASDPLHPHDLFARSDWRRGNFDNYNTLNLFYVGYGGNENTTTRFRRYQGKYYGVDNRKVKPVLSEYTDAAHLLFPNHWYQVRIVVRNGVTCFFVDGKRLFRYVMADAHACDGYFGLRLFKNHVRFTGLTIRK